MMETYQELAIINTPKTGVTVPRFKAQAARDKNNFFGDYERKWMILLSHPVDFMPICTLDDHMTFAQRVSEFSALNCEFGSLSNVGLCRKINQLKMNNHVSNNAKLKNVDFSFSSLEGITVAVAKKYGMIELNANFNKALKVVLFIDPKVVVRAAIYYPLSMDRNFDDLKSTLIAMQMADEYVTKNK